MLEERKQKIIELLNKFEEPYDELHKILDKLQDYYEVSSAASHAQSMLSIINKFIVIEKIEKAVRPELYGISGENEELERVIKRMINKLSLNIISLTKENPDEEVTIGDVINFSISQEIIDKLDKEKKRAFFINITYFIESLKHTVEYLEKYMPDAHKLYKYYENLIEDNNGKK